MSALRNLARGAKNQKAFENLIKYYGDYDKRPDKVGQGSPKPQQIELYVHFFGQDFNADLYYKVKANAGTWDTHKDKFTGRAKVAVQNSFPGPDDIILPTGRARPAKVVVTTGLSLNGVRKVSDRTKLPYLSYGGTSGSIPFGRLNGTDEELTAYNALLANFKTNGKIPQGTRVSRIKEKI